MDRSTRFTKSKSASHTEEEYVEDWLSNNEERAENMIESWLMTHPQTAKNLYLKYGHILGMDVITPLSSVTKSKSMRHYISTPSIQSQRTKRKPASELRKLEKQQLFVELLKDVVAPDVDVNHLTHKILVNVLLLTKADRSSLFLVEGTGVDQILVSRLFDIAEGTSVKEAIRDDSKAIKMAVGVGIAGTVAKTGEKINLENAYEDPRFNRAVDITTGYQTKSILCMPIKTTDGQVIGVAQVINKIQGDGIFTKEDEDDFQMYLNFCAIGIVNAQLFDHSFALSRRLQILLHLAKGLFEDTTELELIMNKVMQHSLELIPCESCSVLLVDTDLNEGEVSFTEAFQIDDETISENVGCIRTVEIEVISDLDVAKHVATKATPIVMCSVGLSSLQSPDSQHFTLNKDTNSILCIPIFNKDGRVMGIIKLTNKLRRACFSQEDMESLEVFATFCGLGIHNVMIYERIAIASARKKVALDILSYHASSSIDEVGRLQRFQIPESSQYKLETFRFDDGFLSEDHTVLASVRMFIDSGMVEAFKINAEVLYRWVLTVKKNYRPVIYHNWRHAFNVAQMMFAMFQEGKIASKLSKLEQLALLIGCFCHDLDHRGTNNAFQIKSGSVLAKLYSTSTMEHHHFDHCIMILNSEGNQILNGLTPTKYDTVLKMLESAILATDLALYIKKREAFKVSVEKDQFSWEKERDRDSLRAMMMTACDVAAISKPWKIQKRVASMVANEFFEQGDKERTDLQVEPIAMMDRKKKDELPKMQVGFIDFVCLPLYKVLADLVPEFSPIRDGVITNRNNWELLASDCNATLQEEPDSPDSAVAVEMNLPDTTSPVEGTTATIPAQSSDQSLPGVPPSTVYMTPTSDILPGGEDIGSDGSVTNGPVEGWRHSTGSSEDHESPGPRRKSKTKTQLGTHAEVASTRKHLKKCSMS